MALLNTPSSQHLIKEKRYSSDNGYYTGGRPSTETPPGSRSCLSMREKSPMSDCASLESDATRKSSVDELNEALLNILTPSVSVRYPVCTYGVVAQSE